jgi:hypothetical protein
MKKLISTFGCGSALCAALATVPVASHAQVWAYGPNGLGYVTTPNPISPNCVAPQIWTLSNGHYMCANPPAPNPAPGGGTITPGIPLGTNESQVCLGALATINPWGTPDSGFFHWTSDLAAGESLYGSLSGPQSGTVDATYNAWFNSLPWGNIAQIEQTWGAVPSSGGTADMWVGYDGYGGYGACWVSPGTTNVLGVYYILPEYEANGA